MENQNCEEEEVLVPHVFKAVDENGDKKKTFFRKPKCCPWTGTVIIYAAWCLLLFILTASGHFLNSQSFGCVNSKEDFVASRLRHEGNLVYVWSGISLLGCVFVLLELWRKQGFCITVLLGFIFLLVLTMCLTFPSFVQEEAQEIEEFEKHYNRLQILYNNTLGDIQNQLIEPTCDILSNVYHWQAEFKCCGVQGYQDWGSSIPDSCLCDGQDTSSGCVGVGNSSVYEKPCLPTVLSLLEKRSFTFRAVMIAWMVIVDAPIVICLLCELFPVSICCYFTCGELFYDLCCCLYKACGGEEMVPVVFFRKNNNNQTEEENGNDDEENESGRDDTVVLEVKGGKNAEGEEGEEDCNYIPVTRIPLSELKKLQEELDPPPVQHKARSWSLFLPYKTSNLYTILLDEGSPLLPSGAVMVDANKTTRMCVWGEGLRDFFLKNLVLPGERNQDDPAPLLF